MSLHRRQTMRFSALLAIVFAALLLLVMGASYARSQEADESLLEQEMARAAIREAMEAGGDRSEPDNLTDFVAEGGAFAAEPAPRVPPGFRLPLFAGVDDANIPALGLYPGTPITSTAFSGVEVWGAAYDAVNDIVYISSGSVLHQWSGSGAPVAMGEVSHDGGVVPIVSLAFYDGKLYGTSNVSNEAVYTIDVNTLEATVYIDYPDAEYDFGGLAFDPTDGKLYGLNDTEPPHGRGLYHIESDLNIRFIAPYPTGESDIDGLAIGPDRRAYFVPDEPGSIYVYDLALDAFWMPFASPWTSSELFSGATYLESDTRVVCSAPNLAIPDDTPEGVSDSLTVGGSMALGDLNLMLDVSHTWVGDLTVTLRHDDSGTEAVVVDRPGVPGSALGCGGDNIDAIIDDEGRDGSVEESCSADPAISGAVVGGDPPDNTLMARFDGENLAGSWTLTVSDSAGNYSGTLNSWCLAAEGGQPSISVTPASLAVEVVSGDAASEEISVENRGDGLLLWQVVEEMGSGSPLASSGALANSGALFNGPIYYDDRAAFEAVYPGLSLEDFEAGLWGPGDVMGCPAPANSSSDNSCFSAGSIAPGVSFEDNPLNDSDGAGNPLGLAGIGELITSSNSKALSTNTSEDALEIFFDPPVNVAGMELVRLYGFDGSLTITLYDASDALIATTSALSDNAGKFWGVASQTPIARMELVSPLTGPGGYEAVDNVTFGAATVCSDVGDAPWLVVSPDSGETPARESTPLTAAFDAAGMSPGVYEAALCFSSNDAVNPIVRVPVSMTVSERMWDLYAPFFRR